MINNLEMNKFITRWFEEIEFTIAPCNNSCWHCFTNAGEVNEKAISLKNFKITINYLKNLSEKYGIDIKRNNPKFVFNHEFLLHPKWYEIFEILKMNNFSCGEEEVLTTNGSEIARKIEDKIFLEKFYKFNPKSIQLVFHGTEIRHDKYVNRKGAFQEIIQTAEFCYDNEIPVYWGYFFSKENINDLPEVYESITRINQEKNIDIFFSIPSYTGRMMLKNDYLRPQKNDFNILNKKFLKIIAMKYKGKIDKYFSQYSSENSFFEYYKDSIKENKNINFNIFKYTAPCIFPDLSIYFTMWKTGYIGNLNEKNIELKLFEKFYKHADEFDKFIKKQNMTALLKKYLNKNDDRLYWHNSLILKLMLRISRGEGWDNKYLFDYYRNKR